MLKIDSKRILPLIVLTFFALSFATLPAVFALLPPVVSDATIRFGEEFTVSGVAGDTSSGAVIEIYWDIVEGPNVHKIGEGYGAADGSYSVDVDAPADVAGSHYIWVKDTHTDATARQVGDIVILPGIDVVPNSDMPGYTVIVEGNGFDAEEDVWVNFYNAVKSVNYENISSATCDDYGYFSALFTVPSVALGDYFINATNYLGNVAVVPFQIEHPFHYQS